MCGADANAYLVKVEACPCDGWSAYDAAPCVSYVVSVEICVGSVVGMGVLGVGTGEV